MTFGNPAAFSDVELVRRRGVKTKAPPTVAPIDGAGCVRQTLLENAGKRSAYAASLRILPKWLSSV